MGEVGSKRSIGLFGALSIGVGGIVGGGFFATFGLTIEGAKGGTPVAFLIGGLIALATAFSYVGLALRYPGPGGTVAYLRTAFGSGLLPATLSVLLIFSYVAIMSIYASALASYGATFLPASLQPYGRHVIASSAIIAFGLINFVGAGLMAKLEGLFNIGKLAILAFFILAGLLVGQMEWTRLQPAEWAPATTVVASGMLGFLAYEGFELIANASAEIKDPKRVLPVAFIGSVLIAIAIYMLATAVGVGHLSFEQAAGAADFAVSEAAGNFLGPIGFTIMSIGAILASASAINADYFGASKLPPMLSNHGALPSAFQRLVRGQSPVSLAVIGIAALAAVNLVEIEILSSATSGGFLLVFAAVNLAALRLRHETGTRPFIPAIAFAACLIALAVMIGEFLSSPATVPAALAVGAIVLLSLAVELLFRSVYFRGR